MLLDFSVIHDDIHENCGQKPSHYFNIT